MKIQKTTTDSQTRRGLKKMSNIATYPTIRQKRNYHPCFMKKLKKGK